MSEHALGEGSAMIVAESSQFDAAFKIRRKTV